MSSSLAALTSGGGGIAMTADSSGNLDLKSGTTTVLALTATGIAVTGTLSASTPMAVASGGTGVTASTQLIQNLNYMTGAVATGTTTIPHDDTIPQITEGDQYMTLAITPTSATNVLEIDVSTFATANTIVFLTTALFMNSVVNALAAMTNAVASNGYPYTTTFKFRMIAGTTSAITFRVRIGGNNAGTTTFNGTGGARFFGGVIASSITIKEYTA